MALFSGQVSGMLVQNRTMLFQWGLARAGQVIKVFLLRDSGSPSPPSSAALPAQPVEGAANVRPPVTRAGSDSRGSLQSSHFEVAKLWGVS